ncbi:MAG: serine/threonine protein kinase [Deltaproteobacteria bacterium]|nr:serine/threonine protein kinase [Deltaproteobacteria bacterium]
MTKSFFNKEFMSDLGESDTVGRYEILRKLIVAIHDVGAYKDFCYIAMEYIEGSNLDKFCRKNSLLPVNKVIEIIFSVCNALDYAHKQGVIHRDIKPANIMLDKSGIAKITDFGIAQMTEKTAEMGIFGTPSYMSPEQLKDEVAGNESDIFSLGCVLYELLSGEQAFPGDNSFSIMYKITNEETQRSGIRQARHLPMI